MILRSSRQERRAPTPIEVGLGDAEEPPDPGAEKLWNIIVYSGDEYFTVAIHPENFENNIVKDK